MYFKCHQRTYPAKDGGVRIEAGSEIKESQTAHVMRN